MSLAVKMCIRDSCYGVSYAGYSLFPIKNSSQTDALAKPATTAAQLGNVNANKDITATVYDVSDIVDSVISSVVAINGEYTQEVNYGWFGSCLLYTSRCV